ncbi:hypothetical protein PQI23_13450 [Leucobacter sp. USCH14]|uniref:hypothetical protein n=1 Tax=Leucobacter sp. USCH14 TaxID=3024838 RepID=UPI00309A523A
MSTATNRTCMQAPIGRGAYCGRPGATIVAATAVTCTNCQAALRADERASK